MLYDYSSPFFRDLGVEVVKVGSVVGVFERSSIGGGEPKADGSWVLLQKLGDIAASIAKAPHRQGSQVDPCIRWLLGLDLRLHVPAQHPQGD